MNCWKQEYAEIYESWDFIADTEYSSFKALVNNSSQNSAMGSERKMKNDMIHKKKYKKDTEMSEVASNNFNRNSTDQTMPVKENGVYNGSYLTIGKNQENRDKQKIPPNICSSCSSNAFANAQVPFPSDTTNPPHGGANCKPRAGQGIWAKLKHTEVHNGDDMNNIHRTTGEGNSKNEEKHLSKTCDDCSHGDIANENDIKITFGTEAEENVIRKPSSNNEHLQPDASETRAHKIFSEDPNIETLEDALNYFDLYSTLLSFQESLENVRKHKKSKDAHESDLKNFDKQIQKLSFKYHPDKVKNRGGSAEEMEIAQKLQTALNATRTVLSVLNKAFLEDINTDHSYGYYIKLNINSLGNEDEVKNHIYEVLFKISYLSEIKQNIIVEIRHFLTESKNCVKYFFDDDVSEFEKCQSLALFYLKKCIKGHKKLILECKTVQDECTDEKMYNIYSLIRTMSRETSANLSTLKEIKRFAKKSLAGACQFYCPVKPLDEYFVMPFASYVNVIVMCNIMLKNGNQTFWGNLRNCAQPEPAYNHPTSFLNYLYYLSSFLSGNSRYKTVVERTLGDRHLCSREIQQEFRVHLEKINKWLEDSFRVSNYRVNNSDRNHLLKEYMKYMKMMADFKMKEKELKNDIKTSFLKLVSRNEVIEDEYGKAMRESEEMDEKVSKSLEQSRLLREQFSASFPTMTD